MPYALIPVIPTLSDRPNQPVVAVSPCLTHTIEYIGRHAIRGVASPETTKPPSHSFCARRSITACFDSNPARWSGRQWQGAHDSSTRRPVEAFPVRPEGLTARVVGGVPMPVAISRDAVHAESAQMPNGTAATKPRTALFVPCLASMLPRRYRVNFRPRRRETKLC